MLRIKREGLEITLLHCHSEAPVLSEVEGSTYFASVQAPRSKNLNVEISILNFYELNRGAVMVKEGNKAPDFCLSGLDEKGEKKEISLKDFKGKKVFLCFYPKDDTPGCT